MPVISFSWALSHLIDLFCIFAIQKRNKHTQDACLKLMSINTHTGSRTLCKQSKATFLALSTLWLSGLDGWEGDWCWELMPIAIYWVSSCSPQFPVPAKCVSATLLQFCLFFLIFLELSTILAVDMLPWQLAGWHLCLLMRGPDRGPHKTLKHRHTPRATTLSIPSSPATFLTAFCP